MAVMYVFIFGHIWIPTWNQIANPADVWMESGGSTFLRVARCVQHPCKWSKHAKTCPNMSKPICWVLFWTSITIVRNNWKMQQNTNITHKKMHMKITHPCSRHVFCPLILRRVFQRAQNKTLDRSLLRSSRCIWVFINVERVCDRFWVLTTC